MWAESQFQQRNPVLLLQAQIPRSNVGQVANVSPTPWVISQEANITRLAPETACLFWLGCWSNNSANSHPSPGAFNRRVLCSCLVQQCLHPPHRPCHQRRLATCDWMPASYTSGQPSHPRRHPTCWFSSQWSQTVSDTPCHGAWTPAPLSVHPSIEWRSTASQIETSICTRRTTTHQFIWQQQHIWGELDGSPLECGMGGQPYKTPHFHHRHRHPLSGVTLPRRAWVRLNRLRAGVTFPLLLVQMGHGLCGLWVWCRRTSRRPFCPPMSNPSTSPWTAQPDGSGRWDNRMAAQNLTQDLVRPSSG